MKAARKELDHLVSSRQPMPLLNAIGQLEPVGIRGGNMDDRSDSEMVLQNGDRVSANHGSFSHSLVNLVRHLQCSRIRDRDIFYEWMPDGSWVRWVQLRAIFHNKRRFYRRMSWQQFLQLAQANTGIAVGEDAEGWPWAKPL